jgi:hypothetical protein
VEEAWQISRIREICPNCPIGGEEEEEEEE